MKKKTLGFFSKTLPILKADDTLPKVARYEDPNIEYNPTIFHSRPDSKINFYKHRSRRSAVRRLGEDEANEGVTLKGRHVTDEMILEDISQKGGDSESALRLARQGRAGGGANSGGGDGWCDDSHGVFCMLFNAFRATTSGVGGAGSIGGIGGASSSSGEGKSHVDRLGDSDVAASGGSGSAGNALDAPMTPCPSAVEYVTPVFAKNYQGVWRYVVQIPYEGYFTQTVEVVKCL